MGRIVDSLKNFYTKQGGTAADVRGLKSISGVIDKISNLSFGGGGGGSSDVFIVHYSFDGEVATADKTYAEITEAITNGKAVIANFGGAICSCNYDASSSNHIKLNLFSSATDTLTVTVITHNSDNTITIVGGSIDFKS